MRNEYMRSDKPITILKAKLKSFFEEIRKLNI